MIVARGPDDSAYRIRTSRSMSSHPHLSLEASTWGRSVFVALEAQQPAERPQPCVMDVQTTQIRSFTCCPTQGSAQVTCHSNSLSSPHSYSLGNRKAG